GQYSRKSIILVKEVLPTKDGIYKKIHKEHLRSIINGIDSAFLSYSRFNIDRLPSSCYSRFFSSVFGDSVALKIPDKIEDTIQKAIENELAPNLISSLDPTIVRNRAAFLRSENQYNSAMAYKMKELDITSAEYSLVLNNEYVIVPLINQYIYGIDQKDGAYVCRLKIGLSVYRIRTDKAKVSAIFVKSFYENGAISINSNEYAKRHERRRLLGLPSLPPINKYVFQEALREAIDGLLYELLSINDFRLTSQILSTSGSKVSYQIDSSEIADVGIDGIFEFKENVELQNGNIKTITKGWNYIQKIEGYHPKNEDELASAKNASVASRQDEPIVIANAIVRPTAYNLIGKRVSGSPYTGLLVMERPHSAYDIEMMFRRTPTIIQSDSADNIDIIKLPNKISGMMQGIEINVGSSRIWNISQLKMRYSLSYSWMNISSNGGAFQMGTSRPINTFNAFDLGVGAKKTIYFRRLAPEIHCDGLFGSKFFLGGDTTTSMLSQIYIGAKAGAGMQIALSPDYLIGLYAEGRYDYAFGKWAYHQTLKDYTGNEVDIGVRPRNISIAIGILLSINAWQVKNIVDRMGDGMASLFSTQDDGDKDITQIQP
ncbi:MAG: hypothetical protein JNL74_06825, partial [Fibrobacteres bacterium]|nr:hypothetical protein [Fibrobacterota bacterium]